MTIGLSIAEIGIRIRCDHAISVSEAFRPFVMDPTAVDYEIRFRQGNLPLPECMGRDTGEPVALIRHTEDQEQRVFYRSAGNREPLAVGTYHWDRGIIEITIREDADGYLDTLEQCFLYIAWEELLRRKQRMMLHACCIQTAGGGICFSGPSGIGKSTQGALWEKYMGSSVLNGDRPILWKKNGHWVASGSPYAGSSKVYVNQTIDLNGIVLLRQAETCSIERLDAGNAFREVFAQITVDPRYPDRVEWACDMVECLVGMQNIWRLSCTPDRRAVDLLNRHLHIEEAKADGRK